MKLSTLNGAVNDLNLVLRGNSFDIESVTSKGFDLIVVFGINEDVALSCLF